jgi:hypothetical protein
MVEDEAKGTSTRWRGGLDSGDTPITAKICQSQTLIWRQGIPVGTVFSTNLTSNIFVETEVKRVVAFSTCLRNAA